MKTLPVLLIFLLTLLFSCAPHRDQNDCNRYLEKAMALHIEKRIQELSLEIGLQQDTLLPGTPIYRADGQQLSLHDLLEPENILLFRYSNLSCNACNVPILQAIDAFKEQHPDARIAIIASYDNLRTFSSFCRTYSGKVPVYFVYPHHATGAFRASIPPYFCIASPEGTIRAPFIVPKELDGMAEAYLGQIRPLLSPGSS